MNLDYSDFSRERAFAAGLSPRVKRAVWIRVRESAFTVERYIKLRMPVDTGRARASWGHSTAPADGGDGIWQEYPDALAIVQGSRVEYIEYLNEGSSTQAPAGFIDAEQARGIAELEKRILDDLEALFK